MTNAPDPSCPQCGTRFPSEAVLRSHAAQEHQQAQQRQSGPDAEAMQTLDRQQDLAGRTEQAGQPSGNEGGNVGRNLHEANPPRPGADIDQQTQQQQRQVE